ncbi:MAG: protoheme IX farnesyltransferase, partial [Gammaproteobacteria bacterium]|nr:protoheme IX farnesyltransferase [Gammaproteobacteria bacterium]
AFTRLHILFYTVLMVIASLMPFLTGMSGLVYLAGVVVLDLGFLYYAIALQVRPRPELPMRMFAFSISYLLGVFILLLGDHYLQLLIR